MEGLAENLQMLLRKWQWGHCTHGHEQVSEILLEQADFLRT